MGNVAHDLKTPLHSIEADIDMLDEFFKYLPSNAVQEAFNQIVKLRCSKNRNHNSETDASLLPSYILKTLKTTCQFMTMAINRSQDYMKASSNIALVPSLETLSIVDSVSLSITCINHLYVEIGRQAALHPIDDKLCPYVISDKHWLVENVLCLLSNAMKYSDKGDVEVYVRLLSGKDSTCPILKSIKSLSTLTPSENDENNTDTQETERNQQSHPEMVFVGIEDHGIGIPIENRSKLFLPFGQAQRMTGGTGLGLYSLSKRIEALGGNCGVESRHDGKEGSLIWFTFPYRPDDVMVTATDDHNEAEAGRKEGFNEEKSDIASVVKVSLSKAADSKIDVTTNEVTDMTEESLRVLLIDDTLSVLKVTSRMLLLKGHTFVTAMNGSQGLEKLKKGYQDKEFDLCITDLQMP